MQIKIVALTGPSSSGKSTVAIALAQLLGRGQCTLVHLDDFYFSEDKIPWCEQVGERNWDCVGAIDYDRFVEYISDLKSGKCGNDSMGSLEPMESLQSFEAKPELQLTADQIYQLKSQIARYSAMAHYHFVLVDGFMLLHDPRISHLFDVKLLFTAPYATLKARRQARRGYNTVDGFWVDPPGYFDKIVWPEYVKNHRQFFVEGDVEGQISPSAREQLGIRTIDNDGTKLLPDLVSWTLDQFVEVVE